MKHAIEKAEKSENPEGTTIFLHLGEHARQRFVHVELQIVDRQQDALAGNRQSLFDRRLRKRYGCRRRSRRSCKLIDGVHGIVGHNRQRVTALNPDLVAGIAHCHLQVRRQLRHVRRQGVEPVEHILRQF